MSFTSRSFKQTNALYVPLADCAGRVLQYVPGTGAGGSYANGTFGTAAWAHGGSNPSRYTSTISSIGAGGYFRDMGKTVVSASRTFRKVQLLVNAVSTSGVGGPLTATADARNVDYLTGYIEVAGGPGLNGVGGNPAPVAVYPSMY